ncbi:MAG: tyrosine--tRNA ligase [Tenericutes bacterium GWC2_34_14]|nr:MAG: tyrosine--tRNA ligase [Tenericutes bacterium GWA2_35_7]OHE29718.1 MAG: tyrosine--tRNA ligase [Tenericutes bacterium GWC2_34_14]OHE34697.1 MAG: tyrosine--tRNA ligase [Tenericutes bacterium GWE2_34_108]OHE37442.1 MAG: tyrosine--tRNA ligase [Tenericutes bacterium GWF1_35_14]OHE39423.1 MAG: tyrosine--tRNA ligase [Tenericutes bacterium GWF2_35_184]OHE44387.1 MAG: tyrosine--tRNA ligase [Tenericutes bacterium RIFOXYA2_FULL_36_32]OHE47186.1 MAG: tyrosine--tRNA ligase [Tenericutes bacterium RI
MKLYEELLWRGLIKDVSNEEKTKELLNDQKIKFYCGFDPTGESLTVGHLVQVVRMMLLEKYGHTPIVLIGGATGLIGDPRQTSERKLLTLEESLQNAEKIKVQLQHFLNPEKAIFVNNYDWIGKIDMISFLRDYGKHFSINYMIAKDTVQKRLDVGISYTEFSYMLIQAIDFLHLYRTLDCKLQFGGSDQWGNITTGLELIRKLEGENNQAIGLSSPLLLKADGTKFGKSESGALWLDAELTSPYEIYQYFFNASDLDVVNYLKTLTLLDKEEIDQLVEELKEHPENRGAQKKLASEVVKLVHGEKALTQALKVTEALFSGDFQGLDASEFKMLEKTLDTVDVTEALPVVDLLVETKLAQSKREARTFIQSGAILMNEIKVDSLDALATKDITLYNRYIIIRRGKKKYAMIRFVA